LLAAFPAGIAHRSYTDVLVTASKSVIAPARTGGADPMIEALSERELVVLRYLSTRLTNPEIAAALYISRNTLKTHGKAVFRKLAVSSRAEAVEVGRKKRLI
jgi:LuxR family maltose regulon positive regulatory protein